MENFKTENILKLIIPQWKKLAIVAVLAIIVGFFISSPMVIKPLYKSYAVVYPVNLSPSSEESNTEQLLQWFNSEEVKKAVASRFNLLKHYEIDSLDARHETYFNLKYKELVSINATLYESIEISVKDVSPVMAKDLVKGIIEETNKLIMTVKKERLNEYIVNNEIELKHVNSRIDSLKFMINGIRKEYNIVDFQYQSKYISKELTKSPNLSEYNSKTAEGLKIQRTELERLRDVIGSQIVTYNHFANQLENYHLEHDHNVSFTNVVSKPTLPDSKCYPIRSLIVAIITLSSLLIACIIIVFSNIKKQKVD
jgi:LPS O-antigen subunit length determinant protein (WzzB/FepE family)